MCSRLWVLSGALVMGLLEAPHAVAQDKFWAQDKYLHFTGSMLLGTGVAQATGSPLAGFWTAVGVGVAKELYDARNPRRHTASLKDLAWDVMGAYVGAQGIGLHVGRRADGAIVVYTWHF